MQTIKLINADVIVGLKTLADESVDTIVTSPPYWSCRDYHNTGQIGLEQTLEEYHERLLEVTGELKRVMKNSAVLLWNHGDSHYSGGGKACEHSAKRQSAIDTGSYPDYSPAAKKRSTMGKCLTMQNERLIIKMIDEQGWILRDRLIWVKKVFIAKTNKTIGGTMPGSQSDRCTVSYEPVYMLTKKQHYWSDMDAIRVPYTDPLDRWGGSRIHPLNDHGANWDNGTGQKTYRERDMRPNAMGATSPDVWQINTKPFTSGIEGIDHYAAFPYALPERLIKAFCPAEVCPECGHVRKRITESNEDETIDKCYNSKLSDELGVSPTSSIRTKQVIGKQTTGWTSCSCNKGYNPGVVLDCFSGAATTLLAARNLGRSAIGIEISADYCKIAKKRVGFDQSTIDGSIEYIYKVIT